MGGGCAAYHVGPTRRIRRPTVPINYYTLRPAFKSGTGSSNPFIRPNRLPPALIIVFIPFPGTSPPTLLHQELNQKLHPQLSVIFNNPYTHHHKLCRSITAFNASPPPHSSLAINTPIPHSSPSITTNTLAMDFDFTDSVPEFQLDWMSMLNQTDPSAPGFDFSIDPTPMQENGRSSPSMMQDQSVEAMKEMIFYLAALQPVRVNPALVKARPRRNVRISKDPQSVAARQRRERIGERIRTLQQLVPGGTKMDTASMLEEAVRYLKFLKAQVRAMEGAAANAGAFGNAGGGGDGWDLRSVHRVSGGRGGIQLDVGQMRS